MKAGRAARRRILGRRRIYLYLIFLDGKSGFRHILGFSKAAADLQARLSSSGHELSISNSLLRAGLISCSSWSRAWRDLRANWGPVDLHNTFSVTRHWPPGDKEISQSLLSYKAWSQGSWGQMFLSFSYRRGKIVRDLKVILSLKLRQLILESVLI